MINNGRGIYNSLVAAGFKIPEECQRIVIDIQTEEPVKVYYQCLGDDQQLTPEVLQILASAKTATHPLVIAPCACGHGDELIRGENELWRCMHCGKSLSIEDSHRFEVLRMRRIIKRETRP